MTVSKKGWRGGYVRSFLNLHQPRSQSYPTVVKRAVGKQFSSAYALKSPARRNGTVPRKVHSHGNLVLEPPPQEWPKSLVRTRSGTSCESDGDEEHIVEIESPSKLFASNQTTWWNVFSTIWRCWSSILAWDEKVCNYEDIRKKKPECLSSFSSMLVHICAYLLVCCWN